MLPCLNGLFQNNILTFELDFFDWYNRIGYCRKMSTCRYFNRLPRQNPVLGGMAGKCFANQM